MVKLKSITSFLIASVLGVTSVAWIFSAVHIFHESYEQVDELFDAELAQMARLIQSVVNSHNANKQLDRLEYLDKDIINAIFKDHEYSSLGHKYEQKLAFQIWSPDPK
ncbi:MAG: two-component sensor histidine kinase, partial [Phototrophicales bacterium]